MSPRDRLPQTEGGTFLTDGGIETVLIFHQGIDLPAFAAFPLVDTESGREALLGYFEPFLELAREQGAGFVLTSPTWRANPDWAAEVGYDREAMARVNRGSIALMEPLRAAAPSPQPVLIGGLVGPRGDDYAPGALMTADEAERYHAVQLRVLADTAADFASAITLTYAEEAIGVVRRAGRPAGVDRLHAGDRRTAAEQPAAARGDRPGRRRDGRRLRLLRHQLRAPDALRDRARGAGHPGARAQPQGERLHAQPRRARRRRGARRRRPGRPRRPLRRAPRPAAEPDGAGRVLRNGHPPRARDRRRLGRGVARGRLKIGSR